MLPWHPFTLKIHTWHSFCFQVTVPLGKHDDHDISVSFVAAHGADRFLLDTILDLYSSIQEQVAIASSYFLPAPHHYTNGDVDTSEALKEKVHLILFIISFLHFKN